MERKVSLITMGQGNVIALGKTLESFKDSVDEFVYGDLLIFDEDREVIKQYEKQYNFRSIKLPFNYIFKMGFSSVLNYLSSNAQNDMVIYMNTSEVIDEDYGINDIIDNNPECNSFYFSHRVEKHRWFRCFDRRELEWSGVIHEETRPLRNPVQPYHKPIFMMKDEEKDMHDSFRAAVFNAVKELTYFNNYGKLVDYPKLVGATNEGWVKFAAQEYQSMQERMTKRGAILTAFQTGDYNLLMNAIDNHPEFEKERFESFHGMNFQGARKDIL